MQKLKRMHSQEEHANDTKKSLDQMNELSNCVGEGYQR